MLHSEEDIKLKLVYPFLKASGFDDSELTSEKSFLLRMGKFTYRVDTEEQKERAQPRLDILVRRNGENLCVVEAKSDAAPIGEDEIDQAVSYARLVHPIAPFCIVTNGKEFKAIDTITKDELTSDKLRQRGGYRAALPDEKYYEALKHFIGYSRENLLALCKWEVDLYMRQLRGSAQDLNKKYILDLYAPPADADSVFGEYLRSEAPVFLISGDSGMGKTCWTCHSAITLLNKGVPVLFYRSTDVQHGLLSAIGEDLNWSLSPQYSEDQAAKRFFELFENDGVIIIVDGVDEIKKDTAVSVVDKFLKRSEGRKVKLVLSSKASSLEWLFERDGIPTGLSEATFTTKDGKAYLLREPGDKDFRLMIAKYRTFYRFKGPFEDQALDDAKRSPFLLRLMFEVASKRLLPNITYTTRDFYEEYYRAIIKRFDMKESTEAILTAVARLSYEDNGDLIERDQLRAYLGFSGLDEIPLRLFDLNILVEDKTGATTRIGFYFSKLRDYIVAFKALRWPTLSSEEFGLQASGSEISGVRLDALNLYYSLARVDHKRILDQPLYQNAEEYVEEYERILEVHFSEFKGALPPYNALPMRKAEKIGIIGYLWLPTKTITYHGFRVLENEDERVKFFPIASRGTKLSNLAHLSGASRLSSIGSHRGFRELNVRKEAWSEITSRIKDVAKIGSLNESHSPDILRERVVATYFAHYEKRRGGIIQRMRSISKRSPLTFETIRYAILFERAARLTQDEIKRQKIESGEIAVRDQNGMQSYSSSFTDDELRRVEEASHELARRGEYKKSSIVYIPQDEVETSLLHDLSSLERLGITQIDAPFIAEVDNDENVSHWVELWKPVTLKALLPNLYLAFLNGYRNLVEKNFPTMSQHFPLFNRMPIKCFMTMEDQHLENIQIYLCREVIGTENCVISCRRDDLLVLEQTAKIEYRGIEFDWFLQSSSSAKHLLTAYADYLPFRVETSICTLRYLVYKHLLRELPTALEVMTKEQRSASL